MDDRIETGNIQSVLHEAIRDAELLLSYAVRHGICIDEKISATLVASKKLLSEDPAQVSPEEENRFWQAFGKLSQAVRPVTVKSFKAGLDIHDDQALFSWLSARIFGRRRKISEAAMAVRRFRLWVILALILLLAVQVYWVIGSTLVEEIAKIQEIYEKLESKRNEIVMQAQASGGNPAEDERVQAIEAELEGKTAPVEVNYQILEKWNRVWRIDFLGHKETPDKSTLDEGPLLRLSRALRTAGFALLAIQLYVLPLLYGLIGALAYVLRTLAVEARSLTYTNECDIHYRLRILLGALAGLVVVWLMKETGGDETLGLFKTLSPFAAAFLVGYSVEILFSILDRFIAAFGQEKTDGSRNRDPA